MTQLSGRAAKVHATLVDIGKRRRQLDADEIVWLVQAVTMKLHLDVGCGSMIAYCEQFLGHDLRTAQERVRVAEKLAEQPAMLDAIRGGQILWSAAKELTRITTAATAPNWLEHVKGMPAAQVQEEVSGRRVGDLPSTPRHESEPTYEVTIEMTGDELAAFRAAKAKIVEQAAERISEGQAVARMATAYLTPEAPTRAPDAAPSSRTVQSMLTMEQCPDCARAWDISSGKKIELDLAAIERRICDPKVVGGAHVGATAMAIPQALRRAVLARDRYRCTVPGCRAHGWLELHHLVPLS